MRGTKLVLLAAVIGIALLTSGCTVFAIGHQETASAPIVNVAAGMDANSNYEYKNINQVSGNIIDYEESGNEIAASQNHDYDDGFLVEDAEDILTFNSVDEARSHVPFPIALPSVLPENAELDYINVFPGHPKSQYLVRGAGIVYRLDIGDESWTTQFGPATVILTQTDILSYMPQHFEAQYNAAPSSTLVEGFAYETMRTSIGSIDAVLGAFNMQMLIGLEIPTSEYSINADISWCQNGIFYELHVFAPGSAIAFEELIAIAESVG